MLLCLTMLLLCYRGTMPLGIAKDNKTSQWHQHLYFKYKVKMMLIIQAENYYYNVCCMVSSCSV